VLFPPSLSGKELEAFLCDVDAFPLCEDFSKHFPPLPFQTFTQAVTCWRPISVPGRRMYVPPPFPRRDARVRVSGNNVIEPLFGGNPVGSASTFVQKDHLFPLPTDRINAPLFLFLWRGSSPEIVTTWRCPLSRNKPVPPPPPKAEKSARGNTFLIPPLPNEAVILPLSPHQYGAYVFVKALPSPGPRLSPHSNKVTPHPFFFFRSCEKTL